MMYEDLKAFAENLVMHAVRILSGALDVQIDSGDTKALVDSMSEAVYQLLDWTR